MILKRTFQAESHPSAGVQTRCILRAMPEAGGVNDIYTVVRDVFYARAQCLAFKRRFDGYQGREALSPQMMRSIKPYGGTCCIFVCRARERAVKMRGTSSSKSVSDLYHRYRRKLRRTRPHHCAAMPHQSRLSIRLLPSL
jgi:hypothetical protein